MRVLGDRGSEEQSEVDRSQKATEPVSRSPAESDGGLHHRDGGEAPASGESLEFFASSPRGVEDLLAGELRDLGISEIETSYAGVRFCGSLSTAYRVCLWSRIASRVFMPLDRFFADDAESLYAGVRAIPWERHLSVDETLSISARVKDSAFDNSHFVELKAKDAVVDRFRSVEGGRPGVDLSNPTLRIYLFLNGDEVTVGLDLAGEPLHRRGYRAKGVVAPLKENLAAAILYRAGWHRLAREGYALLDPMCGSGTLLIEAAMIARDVAPGLNRSSFGFDGWKQHDPALWDPLVADADRRREAGATLSLRMEGADQSMSSVEAARDNLRRAGFGDQIGVRCESVSSAVPPQNAPQGLLVTNPPWGHRLGSTEEVSELYSLLGRVLKSEFDGWNAAVLGPDEQTLREIGLRWFKLNKLFHGPLACRLAHYRIGRR